MTEINVLDKAVFNRIAAGEVVDRPCSIVKELVENSIDAGAKSISIAIKNGGIDFIRVSDNGKGIAKDDVKTAFLPHATSKIRSVDDLDGIGTLGFRGEALPSIASVAKVTMLTRRPNDDIGCQYVIDNGVDCDYGEMGAPIGTTVTVEGLFDRIPARRKFLAKVATEERAITDLVSKFILSNYFVSFTYMVNDKIVYTSNGFGLEDAIKTVYGESFLQNMIEINSTMSDMVLCGYVGKPSFSKHSRAYQTLIVNGRYVLNDEIAYTIFGCYSKYLMSRQYPVYVLHLNLPYDLVDVNVHPGKLQIKFAIPALVKKIIVDAISEQVMTAVTIPKNIVDDTFFSKATDSTTSSQVRFFETVERENDVQSALTKIHKSDLDKNSASTNVTSSVLGDIDEPISVKIRSRQFEASPAKLSAPEDDVFSDVLDSVFVAQEKIEMPVSARIVGKIFNTYILVEKESSLYLIDQHAAHEKLLFDKYVSEFENGVVSIQKMLLPYEFTVSPEESVYLIDRLGELLSLGFEITQSRTPHTFLLQSTPLCCVGLNVKNFIYDFISGRKGSRYEMMPTDFRSSLMQVACKAAVKGDEDLSDMQIESLLKQMSINMKELFCPHGRPAVIKISKNEIEKWFKRIV